MERPEAQDIGTIILTGFDHQVVLDCVQIVIKEFELYNGYKRIAEDYIVENTSWRVIKLILDNAKLSSLWNGIKQNKNIS